MKKRYLLTAGGVDKKGIVYGLTQLLKKYDFNIEDSSMAMLRHTFSIIMLLSRGKGRKTGFSRDLKGFRETNRMDVNITEIDEKYMKEYKPGGNVYMISISGADRPGIVKEITGEILRKKGNIIGLETKSSEKARPHAYYMLIEADVPKKTTMKQFENALKRKGNKTGVHVTVNRVCREIL